MERCDHMELGISESAFNIIATTGCLMERCDHMELGISESAFNIVLCE
jgi:hypothetical protein